MALDASILEVKAKPAMSDHMNEKSLRARCPKADHEMVYNDEHGVYVVKATNLAPIYFLKSVGPYNAGEIYGLLPINAKINVSNGNGMELLECEAMVGETKKKVAPKPAKVDTGGAGAAA